MRHSESVHLSCKDIDAVGPDANVLPRTREECRNHYAFHVFLEMLQWKIIKKLSVQYELRCLRAIVIDVINEMLGEGARCDITEGSFQAVSDESDVSPLTTVNHRSRDWRILDMSSRDLLKSRSHANWWILMEHKETRRPVIKLAF